MFNEDDEAEFIPNWEDLPLYKKGKEIQEVVNQIIGLIPEENHELGYIKRIIFEDSLMLTAKIANAEGGDLYDLRMENATIIRKAARDLEVQNHNLKLFGFEYVEYYDIIRKLLEEYRLLFIDWVAGFDPWNYIVDRWGLFNPPGVSPFDTDSDDLY
jgi:hypothetical protein